MLFRGESVGDCNSELGDEISITVCVCGIVTWANVDVFVYFRVNSTLSVFYTTATSGFNVCNGSSVFSGCSVSSGPSGVSGLSGIGGISEFNGLVHSTRSL